MEKVRAFVNEPFSLFWTIAARGLAIAFQFVSGIIIARSLGPTDLGQYYYVFTAAMMGMQLTQLGLHVSNTYFYSSRPELLSNLLGNLLYLAATIGVVTGLGIYVIELLLAQDSIQAPIVLAIVLCPLLLLVVSLNTLSVAISQRIFNVLTILQSAAILFATLIVSMVAPTATGFLAGYAAGLGLTAIVAILTVRNGQQISPRFHWPLFIETIAYGIRAHTTCFCRICWNTSQHFRDPDLRGHYRHRLLVHCLADGGCDASDPEHRRNGTISTPHSDKR